tara:strand:- start:38 stop:511 length:474 start_codon:yes stop_codon:yes gene_type:complete
LHEGRDRRRRVVDKRESGAMARKVIEQQYIYKAEVDRVVDGDTVDVLLDLSFGVYRKVRIRANGIDTPESRTRNKAEKVLGLAAKKRMKELCSKAIYVESLNGGKLDKYGRLLANMFTHDEYNKVISGRKRQDICKTLIEEGHAVKYDGGKKKHVWA